MATWKKSPPALITAFDAALAAEPQAERRQMFGYPCAFVNGHMAVGLHEDRLIARVPDEAKRRPCVILGRRMKSYTAIPLDEALAPRAMPHWVSRAVAFTATMAPKPIKPIKPVKPTKPLQPATATGAAKAKRHAASAKPKPAATARKARTPTAASAISAKSASPRKTGSARSRSG